MTNDNLNIEIRELLLSSGISLEMANIASIFIIVISILIISIIANYIAKKIILGVIGKIVKKTKSNWDDILLEKKVFHRLSHIVPILIIYYTISIAFPDSPFVVNLIQKACSVYFVVVLILVVSSFLNGLNQIYDEAIGLKKGTSIKSYVQVVKIIAVIIAVISVLSILLNKEVGYFVTGLGAMTAVLLLIFKDSILGLVGGIQLTTNDMVRIGDWIAMPSRSADGTVTEVSLNTVKVQNWDNTISTIPTYALVTESFQNWRGMEESEGRRIKRSLKIDVKSVKFCSPEMLEKLAKFYVLKDYIPNKLKEIEEYNKKISADTKIIINGRHLTNIGVFRKYLEEYLRNNDRINTDMTLIVRQLQPDSEGIPLEIYAFSRIKSWADYEAVQADIFDHILAVIHEFELRIFQSPSGDDFKKIM